MGVVIEQILINRNPIYLTTDNVRTNDGKQVIERDDLFTAFIREEEPNEIVLGEQVMDIDGNIKVFPSRQEAREYVIRELRRTIYPPDYLHPLHYNTNNLHEILHKQLIFDIGNPNSEDIEETIEGRIVHCKLAGNSPNLPTSAVIRLNNGDERELTFFDIKRIRR